MSRPSAISHAFAEVVRAGHAVMDPAVARVARSDELPRLRGAQDSAAMLEDRTQSCSPLAVPGRLRERPPAFRVHAGRGLCSCAAYGRLWLVDSEGHALVSPGASAGGARAASGRVVSRLSAPSWGTSPLPARRALASAVPCVSSGCSVSGTCRCFGPEGGLSTLSVDARADIEDQVLQATPDRRS